MIYNFRVNQQYTWPITSFESKCHEMLTEVPKQEAWANVLIDGLIFEAITAPQAPQRDKMILFRSNNIPCTGYNKDAMH